MVMCIARSISARGSPPEPRRDFRYNKDSVTETADDTPSADRGEPRGADAVTSYTYAMAAICRTAVPTLSGTPLPLGDWKISDVTTDAIEPFRDIRKASGTTGTNRNLGTLQAAFSWAASKKRRLVDESPFSDGDKPAVERFEERARTRRLQGNECERLLTACGDHLRGVVECALETGMRRGEILSLQWSQVKFEPKAQIVLPAWKTKTDRDRTIPMSSRLGAILEMRRQDPEGERHPPEAYVFGTATGEPILGFKRAWQTAVLKAHGHKATYVKGANLSPESRAELRRIDLHFHDLRREAGSRWLDGAVPLHQVQAWLGHTNVAQTSTYLAVRDDGGDAAMARFEAVRAAQAQPKTSAGDRGKSDDLGNPLQTRCKPDGEKWSGRVDSNHRPLGPEPSALPG
jgi:integrase